MPQNTIVLPGVGSWEFVSIKGKVALPGEQFKVITKNGVSGYAFKSQGFLAEPSALTLISRAINLSIAEANEADYYNLQGTEVTLWDATGLFYWPVFIQRVKVDRSQKLIRDNYLGVSFIGGYRLTTSMTAIFSSGSF